MSETLAYNPEQDFNQSKTVENIQDLEKFNKIGFKIITLRTPKGRERYLFKPDPESSNIEYYKTAEASNLIAKKIGLDFVIPARAITVLDHGKNITGTYSEIALAKNIAKLSTPPSNEIDRKEYLEKSRELLSKINFSQEILTQLKQLAIYDYIIGNSDRHIGNILIDSKNNTIYGIDQDESFDNSNDKKFELRNPIKRSNIVEFLKIYDEETSKNTVENYKKITLPRKYIDNLLNLATNKAEIKQELSNIGISNQVIDLMFERLGSVLHMISRGEY